MRTSMKHHTRQAGLTLVELIISIVIMSVALGGIILAFRQGTRTSVDPMITQQAVATARSYMEEIRLKAYADPDGPSAGCSVPGPESGETRSTYDDVDDYNGLTGTVQDQSGAAVSGLSAYSVSVAVVCSTLGTGANQVDAKRITVTVSNATGGLAGLPLVGYRADI